MEAKRTDLREGHVPVRGQKPPFSTSAEEYLRVLETAERPPKGVQTIQGERFVLAKWKEHLGGTRLDRITPSQIAGYRDAGLLNGLSPRTINLHLTALRNVLAKAVEDGILAEIPRFRRFKNSGARPPTRPRLSDEEFKKLCKAALKHGGRALRNSGLDGFALTESKTDKRLQNRVRLGLSFPP